MNKKTRTFVFSILIALMCYYEIETNIEENWINYLAAIVNVVVMIIALVIAYKTTSQYKK